MIQITPLQLLCLVPEPLVNFKIPMKFRNQCKVDGNAVRFTGRCTNVGSTWYGKRLDGRENLECLVTGKNQRVDPYSNTETLRIKFFANGWRGVPFYARTGKKYVFLGTHYNSSLRMSHTLYQRAARKLLVRLD